MKVELLIQEVVENTIIKVLEEETHEKCWEIQEKFPIPVSVVDSWHGTFLIKVQPMLMRYETFEKLGQNLDRTQIEYGKKNGRTYSKETERFANAIVCDTYSYRDG